MNNVAFSGSGLLNENFNGRFVLARREAAVEVRCLFLQVIHYKVVFADPYICEGSPSRLLIHLDLLVRARFYVLRAVMAKPTMLPSKCLSATPFWVPKSYF